jgi:hypothetical protein
VLAQALFGNPDLLMDELHQWLDFEPLFG